MAITVRYVTGGELEVYTGCQAVGGGITSLAITVINATGGK